MSDTLFQLDLDEYDEFLFQSTDEIISNQQIGVDPKSIFGKLIQYLAAKNNKKVKFANPLVTEFIEPQWEFDSDYYDYKKEEVLSRKHKAKDRHRLNLLTKHTRAHRVLRMHKFFEANPLGIENNPYLRDFNESPQDMLKDLMILKQSTLKELEFAPRIFSEIHPFDQEFILYINSIGTTRGDERPHINPRKSTPSYFFHTTIPRVQPFFIPETFIPPELERKLWLYRRGMLHSWFFKQQAKKGIISIDFTTISDTLKEMDCKSMMIEDPFSYYKCDVFDYAYEN